MTERVERQNRAVLDFPAEGQREIAGNAKDFARAVRSNGLQQGTGKVRHLNSSTLSLPRHGRRMARMPKAAKNPRHSYSIHGETPRPQHAGHVARSIGYRAAQAPRCCPSPGLAPLLSPWRRWQQWPAAVSRFRPIIAVRCRGLSITRWVGGALLRPSRRFFRIGRCSPDSGALPPSRRTRMYDR